VEDQGQEQAQVIMSIAAEEVPDPTHLHSVDGIVRQPHIVPKTFPLNPERPTKPTVWAAKSGRVQQRTA
jgi:hypothetical protein